MAKFGGDRMKYVLLAMMLSGCIEADVDYVTKHGIEVVGDVDRVDVETWTAETADAFDACFGADSLAMLQYSYEQGLPARLYWRDPPLCIGRIMQAASENGYKHELTHALLDGMLQGVHWSQEYHHAAMQRCGLR